MTRHRGVGRARWLSDRARINTLTAVAITLSLAGLIAAANITGDNITAAAPNPVTHPSSGADGQFDRTITPPTYAPLTTDVATPNTPTTIDVLAGATTTRLRANQPRVTAQPNVRYQNCDAVRAAGAAPIFPGDPGWEPKFDRDNDGTGCETDTPTSTPNKTAAAPAPARSSATTSSSTSTPITPTPTPTLPAVATPTPVVTPPPVVAEPTTPPTETTTSPAATTTPTPPAPDLQPGTSTPATDTSEACRCEPRRTLPPAPTPTSASETTEPEQ